MYFPTLTEVPIIQMLMGLGMGKKQATAYVLTIMILSAGAGWLFGEFV
ncbi:MAG: hypothetical protein AB1428_04080 [Bacteroidota bacterium]